MANKKFMLGIDIGGQTVKTGLYALNNKVMNNIEDWVETAETKKGVSEHVNQMVSIIFNAMQQAKSIGGDVIGVGIASPGRFDAKGKIKPRTNSNVGNTVDEFDGVYLYGEYRNAMRKYQPDLLSIPLTVGNDANAMLAGMMKSIQSYERPPIYDQNNVEINSSCLIGKSVGLIGLGTGLGHAIVNVVSDQEYNFVTDGHASKLRINVDSQDMPIIKKAAQKLKEKSGKEEAVIIGDNIVRAEDLYRSPMLNAMAGVVGSKIDISNNEQHLSVVKMASKYIARTMIAIHSGENEDIDLENGWSDAEKQMAAKTSIYLFGGGLGRSKLGKEMIKYVAKELEDNNINDIRIAQIPDVNVAAYAAAIMAFDSIGNEV